MRLFEVIDLRSHVHLIMELCPGMPLFHVLKKVKENRLPESTCKDIFRSIVSAVAYMHRQNKAQRDLKVDNVLYDAETNKVKIIDFGFSIEAASCQRLDTYCGTP